MRIDETTYRLLKQAAAAERRSLANLIETAALRHLEEQAFMDDAEAREILADAALMRKLQKGHRQTRKREGAFVRGL